MLIYRLQHLYAVFILTMILLKVIKMSIFKGITKRNFIKDYDEKDGLPFFLMEDFESLDCDENAKRKMTAALRDMYPKFVETLKDEASYYSLIERFYAKIMVVDTENQYSFTPEQRSRINNATLELLKHYPDNFSRFDDHNMINNNIYWYSVNCSNLMCSDKDELFREYGIFGRIKTYLCVSDPNKMLELFTEAIEELTKTGHCFDAKVSAYKRHDTICLWVVPEVLQVVKDFADKHAEDLCCALPFVPFNGYVGLSKEFNLSFNAAITTIISSYFMTVSDPSEISVEGLLKNYLHAVFTPTKNDVDKEDQKAQIANKLHENIRELYLREHFILLDSFNAILSKNSIEELKALHETQLEDGRLLINIKDKYIHTFDQMTYLIPKDKN